MRHEVLFIFLFASTLSVAQEIRTVYLDPADSTRNKYIVVHPQLPELKGWLLLVPGMFEQGDDVLVQTNLAQHAAMEGLLTIIPTFSTGIGSMAIDTATQASLLDLLAHVAGHNELKGLPFYIGGFSIGGTCAITYAELAVASDYPIKPAAVFALDSPLDFERMYNGILRESRLPNMGGDAQGEGAYLLKRFAKEFGGTPTDALANYRALSPYSFSDTTQRAIKPLARLPIRLYTEPDLQFWLNDGADFSGMNAYDFAALTNELRRMGNIRVELITTTDKGYREPKHERHPHSWSIIDTHDLVAWLKAQK